MKRPGAGEAEKSDANQAHRYFDRAEKSHPTDSKTITINAKRKFPLYTSSRRQAETINLSLETKIGISSYQTTKLDVTALILEHTVRRDLGKKPKPDKRPLSRTV